MVRECLAFFPVDDAKFLQGDVRGEGGVHRVINSGLVLDISARVVCMVAREVLEVLEVRGGESVGRHPCFEVGGGGLEQEGSIEVTLNND